MVRPDRIIATILGCGSSGGVPRIGNDWGICDPHNPRNRRRRCALLIEGFRDGETEPTRLLIDTGADLREQLLDAKVDRVD
ncbi:MAG TPA: MBL fold metallo-hydrolase, partial [Devosia sp.]|nr:MBL fold metallo-hydrolase [Devosia sp.]